MLLNPQGQQCYQFIGDNLLRKWPTAWEIVRFGRSDRPLIKRRQALPIQDYSFLKSRGPVYPDRSAKVPSDRRPL